MKVKILLPNGKIIKRKPTAESLGNFCILSVVFKNNRYVIGDGTEYLRGMPDVFTLNYLLSVKGNKPQYVLYPEHKKEIQNNPNAKNFYKDYIDIEC